jgi:hypothetical protein
MSESESTKKRNHRIATAIFFLPTLPQRLTFLGIFAFMAITVVAPSYAPYAWGEITLLFFAASAFAIRNSAKALSAIMNVIVISVAVLLITRFVAAGGTIGVSSNHSTHFRYIELDLVVLTIWFLLWVPQLFFDIQLDRDGTGDAQRFLVGLIAATASVLTGIYILLLHFDNGPLRGISMGPLVAGVLGAVLLITPIYGSLIKACWRRGVSGIFQFRKQKQDWVKTRTELRKAIDRASERRAARSSGTDLKAVSAVHDANDAST